MTTNFKKTFIGSLLAFVLETRCCWLTSLAVWLGGATILTVLSQFVNKYDTIILALGLVLFLVGIYQFWKHKKGKSSNLFSVVLLSFITFSISAQNITDKQSQILGKWHTHDKRAVVEIFEQKGQYFGKIVWLKKALDKEGKPRRDTKNQKTDLHNRVLIGLTIMKNFRLDGSYYTGGTIYDPDSGSTFNCKLWLTADNELKVRDYCGIFYKTFIWIKIE